jgi:hypothetical protein
LLPLLLAACTARSFPLDGAAPPATPRGEALPLTVGVAAASGGPNVARIRPLEVGERFARALREAGLFAEVGFPLTELATRGPDLALELSVASRHDLHVWRNLAKDVAVGLSVMLLQPLLPVTRDLELELGVRARDRAGRTLLESGATCRFRFESTWLRPREGDLARWHDEAVAHAVRGVVERLASEGALWRRVAAAPGARPAP